MNVVHEMLARYEQITAAERTNAMREVMQDIALAGLHRGGFFDRAAFYGGTCLRVFHGLPRYSEDLDFSLLATDKGFKLDLYFDSLRQEFEALGFSVEIGSKQKTIDLDIASAFLKKTASQYDVQVRGEKILKIKIEVDTDPPLGFETEEKLLLQPYSFFVRCFTLPDLFAGKMHALLFRPWKNRVKGRDWFDFEWYARKAIALNREHLAIRAVQSGHLDPSRAPLGKVSLGELLEAKIESLDIDSARADVARFLRDPAQTDIWSRDYFRELGRRIVDMSVPD